MFAQNFLSGHVSTSSVFVIPVLVGLAAALPLGPISILSIQRAVTLGFWRAFLPTLGAVAANGLLGIVAALGSGFITTFVLGNSFWFRLFGCVLLLAMGAKLLTLQPADRNVPGRQFDPLQLTTLNFAIILSNPLILAFFMASFTFMGLDPGRHIVGHSLVVGAGIAFGSLVWFTSLCGAASVFHRKLGDAILNRARAGVGGLFILMALLSAASVLMAG